MWAVIGILILIGVLLLVLEILVIPGAGFPGVVGFLMLVTGVWFAYDREGVMAGNLTLLVTVLINIVTLIVVMRSKTWKQAQLKTAITGKLRGLESANLQVGNSGRTVTRCAPMGKAAFGDYELEVDAGTAFLDTGTEVEIVKIVGSKVFIKPLKL